MAHHLRARAIYCIVNLEAAIEVTGKMRKDCSTQSAAIDVQHGSADVHGHMILRAGNMEPLF